ncbi:5'-AMP-activated protein kinase subunit beta-2 isoform 1-T2 [Synchiropus picturatus]
MGNTGDRMAAERHGAKAHRSDSGGSHKDQEHGAKMVDSTDDPNIFNTHGPESKPSEEKEFTPDLDDLVKTGPQARPTVIRWGGGGKEVYIAGSFNNWSTKIPLNKSHNDFVAILDLPEGEHQYKFFVDGQWVHDPSEVLILVCYNCSLFWPLIFSCFFMSQIHLLQPTSCMFAGINCFSVLQPVVTSQLGTINNLIQVKKSDFEVFDALQVDSLECSDTSDLSSSPPGPYGQEQYSFRPEEHFKAPPMLPPHLLQVILNKDTNVSCDPALLPEPNHVMLNHLYALSIKDGVMVLSATHRYKKKYVTSLLYKPI